MSHMIFRLFLFTYPFGLVLEFHALGLLKVQAKVDDSQTKSFFFLAIYT